MTIKEILQDATEKARKLAERLEGSAELFYDIEVCHSDMDDLLCATIEAIGAASGCTSEAEMLIAAYNSTEKWYA